MVDAAQLPKKKPQKWTCERLLGFTGRTSLQIRQHARSVWQLTQDPLEISEWALRRLEMCLGDENDQLFLRQLVGVAHNQVDREEWSLLAQMRVSTASRAAHHRKQQIANAEAWQSRRKQIIRREEQRRAGSREARSRLERCHNNPPARPRRLTLAERMEKAYRRRRYLLSGT